MDFEEVIRQQMGVEPSELDPVTLDLFKSKFLGQDAPTKGSKTDKKERKEAKKDKQKKSKKRNIIDETGEDEVILQTVKSERDIHLDKKVKVKGKDGKETTVKSKLDFDDIFNQLDKTKASEKPAEQNEEVINTTKLKKQLKNLKRDPSK